MSLSKWRGPTPQHVSGTRRASVIGCASRGGWDLDYRPRGDARRACAEAADSAGRAHEGVPGDRGGSQRSQSIVVRCCMVNFVSIWVKS